MYVYACPQKTGWTKAKRTENMQQVESKNCVINSKKRGKDVFTIPIYRPASCKCKGIAPQSGLYDKIWTVKNWKSKHFRKHNSLLVYSSLAHDLAHNFTGIFMPDLHFAYLIGNAYITSEIFVYLYRAFNSSFISLHIEMIHRQHSMSSISSYIQHPYISPCSTYIFS